MIRSQSLIPVALLTLVLLGSARAARASSAPSFSLDECAWNASHIVVACPEGPEGTVRVLESWAGDLRPGETLSLPGLGPLREQALRDLGTEPAPSNGTAYVCSESSCSSPATRV